MVEQAYALHQGIWQPSGPVNTAALVRMPCRYVAASAQRFLAHKQMDILDGYEEAAEAGCAGPGDSADTLANKKLDLLREYFDGYNGTCMQQAHPAAESGTSSSTQAAGLRLKRRAGTHEDDV